MPLHKINRLVFVIDAQYAFCEIGNEIFTFLKEIKQAYKTFTLSAFVSSRINFWTNWPIFSTFGMNVTAMKVNPTIYFLISYDH
jgi:hypothetical protein